MRQLFCAAGLLLAAVAPVRAQDVCSQYRPTPAVGSWAEYVNTRGDQSSTMRLAIVGQEKRDGKDAVWFESASESPRGKMVVELLVPSFPFAQGDVMEMVVKRGDDPAMKMPGAMMGGAGRGGPGRGRGGNAASSWETECKTMTVVGPESVTVPAGTFKTTHLRNSADSTDVWVNKDVPFGFVKSVSRGGSMTLKASGKNARKSITETPQEMTGMPGM